MLCGGLLALIVHIVHREHLLYLGNSVRLFTEVLAEGCAVITEGVRTAYVSGEGTGDYGPELTRALGATDGGVGTGCHPLLVEGKAMRLGRAGAVIALRAGLYGVGKETAPGGAAAILIILAP